MLAKPCEIIYVKKANGWKWRSLTEPRAAETAMSEETFALFFDCVSAARALGYNPPTVKCR